MHILPVTELPNERPDEPLLSLIARYHYYYGFDSVYKTIKKFYGRHVAPISDEFPTRLETIVERLQCGEIDFNYAIRSWTSIPYYARFWSPARLADMRQRVKGAGGNTLRLMAGARWVNIKRTLSLCKECVKSDQDRYGHAHWHRVHQLPGVMVCPHHKGNSLMLTGVPKHSTRHILVLPEQALQGTLRPLVNEGNAHLQTWFESIASVSDWLLNQPITFGGKNYLRKLYCAALQNLELMSGLTSFKRRQIADYLSSAIPKSLLGEFDIFDNLEEESSWPFRILSGTENIHPLRHIIISLALSDDFQEFFTPKGQKNEINETPNFYCLNKVCPNSGKKIPKNHVKKIRPSKYSSKSYDIICPICAYHYHSSGISENRQFHNLVSPGKLWEDKLRECANTGVSASATASALGVCHQTVIRRANGLGIEIWGSLPLRASRNPSNSTVDTVEELRSEFLAIKHLHPEYSRSDFWRKEFRITGKLKLIDREWLLSNLPDYSSKYGFSKGKRPVYNWQSIDLELAAEIYEIGQRLIDFYATNPPGKWVGMVQVLEKLTHKNKNTLARMSERTPLSKEALSYYRDLHKMIKVRRIEVLARNLLDGGVQFNFDNLLLQLGLDLTVPPNARLYDQIVSKFGSNGPFVEPVLIEYSNIVELIFPKPDSALYVAENSQQGSR